MTHQQAVGTTRAVLIDRAFSAQHRTSPTVFIPARSLSLAPVAALILRKGVKYLQILVHEAIGQWGGPPVRTNAFANARNRLQQTTPARAHRAGRDHPQPAALGRGHDRAAVRGQQLHRHRTRLDLLDTLPDTEVERPNGRYDVILEAAPGSNPNRQVAQSRPHNLIKHLGEKRDDVLRFITDLRMPFDNNQAERDIRMPELKQKVAGGFRTDTGMARFATIRSYLSTPHKQGADIFEALVLTFPGNPPMPTLT